MYNRDLYIQTIQAMKKIEDIKQRRERKFWENRMKLAEVKKVEDLTRELEKHVDLIDDKEVQEEVREKAKVRREVEEERRREKSRPRIRIEEEVVEQ